MERVSSLFVTKTVYAAVFALAIGVSGAVFPFLPRHMSLVSELTIGIPAFALSFRATDVPCRAGYLSRVFSFAVPAGHRRGRWSPWRRTGSPAPRLVDASLAEARTASTFALVSIAFWILYRLMRPVDRYDAVPAGRAHHRVRRDPRHAGPQRLLCLRLAAPGRCRQHRGPHRDEHDRHRRGPVVAR